MLAYQVRLVPRAKNLRVPNRELGPQHPHTSPTKLVSCLFLRLHTVRFTVFTTLHHAGEFAMPRNPSGPALIRSPQNLEDRPALDSLCASSLGLIIGGIQLRATVIGIVWVDIPKRMHDDLDDCSPPPGWYSSQGDELPLRLGSKVGSSGLGCEALPVWDSEIKRRVWIKREARQIQSKPPIQNIVKGQIAEVAKAIRTRRLANI